MESAVKRNSINNAILAFAFQSFTKHLSAF